MKTSWNSIRKRKSPDDLRLIRLIAIGVLLSLFSFLVLQNSVVINVRFAYFIGALNEIEMRLGTALIIAGIIGFWIGWLVARWRR